MFDGSKPRSWIHKCNGYFRLIPSMTNQQKVSSIHFDRKTALWVHNFNQRYIDLTLEQFLSIISTRFEEIKDSSVIAEFNKLKQTGNYEEYVDKFEELKTCMLLITRDVFSET